MSYTDVVICIGPLLILETWPPIYRSQERTVRDILKASQVHHYVYFRYTPCLTDLPSSSSDALMTHKYRGCIIVLSINRSVEPNEEQKVLTSGFDQSFTVNTSKWVFRGIW
jgi:hypothetical protein